MPDSIHSATHADSGAQAPPAAHTPAAARSTGAPTPSASYTPVTAAPEHISTALFDSIVADTVKGRVPHFVPRAEADSLAQAAVADSIAAMELDTTAPQSVTGIAPRESAPPYYNSTPLAAVMMATLLLLTVSPHGLRRTLKVYSSQLWSVRGRRNVFDDEQTPAGPMAVVLGLVFTVFGGVVLYNVHGLPAAPTFPGAAASMALLGCYYMFERCAYWLVGYAFGSDEQRRLWLGGFASSQAFAGLGMAIPAILTVYMPQWHDILLIISLTIYFIFRLIFIGKGVRIFYRNFSSLLYFILYLCTLELLPLMALYTLSGLSRPVF